MGENPAFKKLASEKVFTFSKCSAAFKKFFLLFVKQMNVSELQIRWNRCRGRKIVTQC